MECENYMIFEGLLFQIKPAKHKSLPSNLVLCIPESYIPHIIYLYHDNILGGHQGVDRMYWTTRNVLDHKREILFPQYVAMYTQICIMLSNLSI